MKTLTMMTTGAALALSLASANLAHADCMRDENGNFWGDCSNGYDANGSAYQITVSASMPPGLWETAFNIVTNYTGWIGNTISTVNAVAQFAGGWEAIGQSQFNQCQGGDYWACGMSY